MSPPRPKLSLRDALDRALWAAELACKAGARSEKLPPSEADTDRPHASHTRPEKRF